MRLFAIDSPRPELLQINFKSIDYSPIIITNQYIVHFSPPVTLFINYSTKSPAFVMIITTKTYDFLQWENKEDFWKHHGQSRVKEGINKKENENIVNKSKTSVFEESVTSIEQYLSRVDKIYNKVQNNVRAEARFKNI